jgi:hypothetical protein
MTTQQQLDDERDLDFSDTFHNGPEPAFETGLSVVEPQPPALREFREAFMSMPVERMQVALTEYGERRDAFRAWLKSNLVSGVHYGYPPGCEPKYCDDKGRRVAKEVATCTLGYKNAIVPIEQWTVKPSLYAAGADLLCELLWVRDEYAADMETWEQLGKLPGKIIRKCKLFSRMTSEFLGEGSGARTLGDKGGDMNNSLKMADKSAKVSAVLNTWGLRDLLTQDMEEAKQQLHPNPEADASAPVTPPRGDRVTRDEIMALWGRWKKAANPDARTNADWSSYVCECSNRIFDVTQPKNWIAVDVDRVVADLCERGA